ncbi:MAG: hypothetical protein IKT70_06020 [Clostridia bacterium]|nr:hypothetical protein [Clostridia bacterium]
MKKVYALILMLSIIVGLCACSSAPVAGSETTVTTTVADDTTAVPDDTTSAAEEEEEETSKSLVPEPLTMEKLESLPIASDSMTIDEKRQLCVDFFRLSGLVQYTPSQDFTYKQTSGGKMSTLTAGTIYSGLPYVVSGKGNLYTFMHYYDETTGVLDSSRMEGLDFGKFIGNQCSYGSLWAWARVVNSFSHTLTNTTHSNNGCIPIAPFEYECIGDWSADNRTATVCYSNGFQTTYEAYANMKPADGMVMYGKDGGHTQMVSSLPVVVRNTDGTINGQESYLYYIDQGTDYTDYYPVDGVKTLLQADIDVKITFEEMLLSGYIPFTFAEFLGTDPVEAGSCKFNVKNETVTSEELLAGKITANYVISDVTISIYEPDGTLVICEMDLPNKIGKKTYKMSELTDIAKLDVNGISGRRVTVQCRIGNGEKFTVYDGTFTEENGED